MVMVDNLMIESFPVAGNFGLLLRKLEPVGVAHAPGEFHVAVLGMYISKR